MFSKQAKTLLNILTQKKCDFADIYSETCTKTNINISDNKLKSIRSGLSQGMSLRVVKNNKTAHAYTTKTDTNNQIILAKKLVPSCDSLAQSKINLKKQKTKLNFPVQKKPDDVSSKEKIELCLDLSNLAYKQDNRIKQVLITLFHKNTQTHIAHSHNKLIANQNNHIMIIMTITAIDKNQTHTAYDYIAGHAGFEILPKNLLEELIIKTVSRVLKQFKAKKIPGGPMPVVLSHKAGGTIIHEAVGHGLEGDLVANGMSFYKNKLGQQIANTNVTIFDDATLSVLNGSYCFDDEGTPSQKTTLIENGILKTYLTDKLSARKLGLSPTGSGRRESFEYLPIPRMTNLYLKPGTDNENNIISSVDHGVYVAKMGGGQVSPLNGDFMFKAQEAYLIKNGKITDMLKDITLAGNGPTMLNNITMISDKLTFMPSTCGKNGQMVHVTSGIPTIRVEGLVVG